MKTVTFTELCKLPAGTIFSFLDYSREPTGLVRKGDTILDDDGQPIDFFETEIQATDDVEGGHLVVADIKGRHGPGLTTFVRYAVYDDNKVNKLISMLRPSAEPEDSNVEWALMVNYESTTGRGQFSRPEHKGYTTDWREAGRFSYEEAKKWETSNGDKYTAIPLGKVST